MSAIIAVDSQEPDYTLLQQAANFLRKGGLLIYPTETFYALGADHSQAQALSRLLQLKGRSADHTLPLILSQREELTRLCAPGWSQPLVEKLTAEYWPGPLTLVLPAAFGLHASLCSPPLTAQGASGIALRLSSHPVAHGLAKSLGQAIVSTSANLTGHPTCAHLDDLAPSLIYGVDIILDGGACVGGCPSTIIELRQGPPYSIIRQGVLNLPAQLLA